MKSEAIVGHTISIWMPKGKSSDEECFVGGFNWSSAIITHLFITMYIIIHLMPFIRKWPLLNQDSYFHLIEKSFLQEP